MTAPKGRAAAEIRRIAAYDWTSAVRLGYRLGLITDTDLETAFDRNVDVLDLCGFTAVEAVAS